MGCPGHSTHNSLHNNAQPTVAHPQPTGNMPQLPVETGRRRASSILYSPASPLTRRPTSPVLHRRPSSMRSHRKTPYGAFKYRLGKIQRALRRHIKKLPWWQRIGILVLLLLVLTGAILVAIFHATILKKFVPGAIKIRSWKAGWLIPFAVCYFSAFPPLFGYSSSITLAGFIYGLPTGYVVFRLSRFRPVGANGAPADGLLKRVQH